MRDGVLDNCSFIRCSSAKGGGAVYWHQYGANGTNGTVSGSTFEYCTATNSVGTNGGGAVYWNGTNGTFRWLYF